MLVLRVRGGVLEFSFQSRDKNMYYDFGGP